MKMNNYNQFEKFMYENKCCALLVLEHCDSHESSYPEIVLKIRFFTFWTILSLVVLIRCSERKCVNEE